MCTAWVQSFPISLCAQPGLRLSLWRMQCHIPVPISWVISIVQNSPGNDKRVSSQQDCHDSNHNSVGGGGTSSHTTVPSLHTISIHFKMVVFLGDWDCALLAWLPSHWSLWIWPGPTVGWVSKSQYGGVKDIVLWNQVSGRASLWALTSSLLNTALFILPPKILWNRRLHTEKTQGVVRVRLQTQPTTEPWPIISWPWARYLMSLPWPSHLQDANNNIGAYLIGHCHSHEWTHVMILELQMYSKIITICTSPGPSFYTYQLLKRVY
jgi:hypothetical protein